MIRYILQRIARDGRLLIVSKRRIHSKIVENTKKRKRPAQEQNEWQLAEYKTGPLWRVGNQARRLFIDNCNALHKSTPAAAEENIRRIFYNNRIPFFAFVGVALSSGSVATIITKDDELEGMCWEIRDTVTKMHQSREDLCQMPRGSVALEDLEIGPNIGKGCSAAVYAAAWRSHQTTETVSRSVQRVKSIDDYPLALKMMFNYDIQSNALMILRAMYRETVPARLSSIDEATGPATSHWGRPASSVNLPPHANIVTMFNAFCDDIPQLEGNSALYPSALPARLHADGYGRNKSLFLVMKRYDFSLERFLTRPELNSNPRLPLLLFAQLLEAVAHLHRHGVAHRDLKSDNILIERHDQCPIPLLVLTDFGCCLADRLNGLVVPYPTEDVDKGGNAALMAPEIITKRPGPFAVLDYTKSDLWAAGAIAYEIFGQRNPFLDTKGERSVLRNYDYAEVDLPRLGDNCPMLVQRLVENLLTRNPRKRLSPDVAANVMQLFLWAPSIWLSPSEKLPTSDEIIEWLFCMTTKVLCENIFSTSDRIRKKDSYTEYLLISSFLQRASLNRIKQALLWIRTKNQL